MTTSQEVGVDEEAVFATQNFGPIPMLVEVRTVGYFLSLVEKGIKNSHWFRGKIQEAMNALEDMNQANLIDLPPGGG